MIERINLTKKEVEYLIEIYREYESQKTCNKGVGPTYFSNKFNVSRVTAFEILQRLLKRKILNKINGKYYISKEGVIIAKKLIRRHRILETFFVVTLHMNPNEICKKISGIEIFFDDKIIDKICSFLNHPKVCPHGSPIPPGADCNVN